MIDTLAQGNRMLMEGAALEEEMVARASSGTQKMPMLDVIFTGIASNLTSLLKARMGLLAEVEMGEVSYTSWGKMISSLDAHEICVVSSASPWDTGFIVTMDPALFYAIYEVQLNGQEPPSSPPRRYPTTAEKRVARRFIQVFLDEMGSSFNRVSAVTFAAENVETTQQAASMQSAHNACVVARVLIRVEGVQGYISTVIPIASLDPVQDQLSKMFLGENFEGDVTWREMLAQRVQGSSVEVQVVMGSRLVPVSEMLAWSLGDTIDLGPMEAGEVVLSCAGVPILTAVGGHIRNRACVRITGEYREDGPLSPDAEGFTGLSQGDA